MQNDTVIQFSGTVYEKGYGLLPQKVMRDKNLSTTAKTIYAYIVSFANINDEGERSAFPGVKIMMSELNIKSDDTFYRHRKQLIDHGYISIRKNRVEGRFSNNVYIIETHPEKAKKEEKEPHPKNKGTSPHPKKSSTVKSSTVNQGTNINSSIITSFKEEEDNKEGETNSEKSNNKEGKNINLLLTQKILEEKKVEIDTIKEIMRLIKEEYTVDEIEIISNVDIKAQFKHMMAKIGQGEIIYDFASYFVIGLQNKLNNKSTHRHFNKKEEKSKEDRKDIYYNWLEE